MRHSEMRFEGDVARMYLRSQQSHHETWFGFRGCRL